MESILTTLDSVLTTLNDYLTTFYAQLGLERWQLLAIAGAVLLVLLILNMIQRKSASNKSSVTRPIAIPDTIGANLANRRSSSLISEQIQKKDAAQTLELKQVKAPRSWRLATEEYKSSSEKFKQLQREITKSKRSEEHLKFQIDEMRKAYESLLRENTQLKQIETELSQRLNDLPINWKNLDFSANQVDSDSQSDSAKRHGLPLDIHELEAIADLAKRLKFKDKNFQK
jgi:hypothetical protein